METSVQALLTLLQQNIKHQAWSPSPSPPLAVALQVNQLAQESGLINQSMPSRDKNPGKLSEYFNQVLPATTHLALHSLWPGAGIHLKPQATSSSLLSGTTPLGEPNLPFCLKLPRITPWGHQIPVKKGIPVPTSRKTPWGVVPMDPLDCLWKPLSDLKRLFQKITQVEPGRFRPQRWVSTSRHTCQQAKD